MDDSPLIMRFFVYPTCRKYGKISIMARKKKNDPVNGNKTENKDREVATVTGRNSSRLKPYSSDRVIRWDRLDNTANLFPAIAGENATNVYRISVTLFEKIDPERLQKALDIILPKMDGFNVRLRKGFFWFYFEENGKPAPRVTAENTFPCRFIRANRNHSYLFRVTYYDKRINLEVFHVLTDGMGGINFLRELTYQYLRLSHEELAGEGDAFDDDTSLNLDDSFVRNYKAFKPRGFERKKAYLIKAEKLPEGEFGLMHGYLPIAQMKEVCKKYDVSVNTYLVADFAYSVYVSCLKKGASDKPIRIAVPVNLRPYYDSNTTKNFFMMVSAEFHPDDKEYSFEEVLRIIDSSLKSQINKEHLEDLFSYGVGNQQNLALRLFPLPIKIVAMRIVYNQSALANTTTVTNIGKIRIDERYEPYIERFHANIAMSKGQYLKGTICAFRDDYVFTFSTVYADTSVERVFFKQLKSDGVDVRIETNGVFVNQ